ncbi:MAG: DUF6250 domain-containing protein [Bacteroides sp.]
MNHLRILLIGILLAYLPEAKAAQGTKGLNSWRSEDSSGKARITSNGRLTDIVSPDGLTLWYDTLLTGDYEISYRMKVVMENGKYDRLSDMNCFWGAKDPKNPNNLFARSQWRKGIFANYNPLNLFYVGYGGNENKTTRFRQYHGEYYGIDDSKIKPILKEYTDPSHLLKPNKWYEIVINVGHGMTTFRCDGEVMFSLPIEKGEADGYFAIRLWKNHVQLTDLKIRTNEPQFAFQNYRRYDQTSNIGQPNEKTEAIKTLRTYFHEHPYRATSDKDPQAASTFLNALTPDGRFTDLNETEARFERENAYQKGFQNTVNDQVGIFIGDALNRIYCIGEAYRKGQLNKEQALDDKVLKAIVHYGQLEISRPNDKPRFHASCFAIPTIASNIYFALLDQMDEAEKTNSPSTLKDACEMLKVLGLQAYTQPLRNDETDQNIVSLERFRNHVWWVGGNALAYRSLLPVAAMYHSVPMVDLLAEVCQRGISMTSQTTYNDSFWTEGFTADGAGWGHGMQCLIWGYPIDGTFNALNILGMLKGTPWAKKLNRTNVEALMNFFHGGNWYYYKGYRLIGLDRNSYVYNPDEKPISYLKMLNNVLKDWSSSFTSEELKELKQLKKEAGKNRIQMANTPEGIYHGTRWFYNNDDLMKKTPDYQFCINMASFRVDGLESATFADNYNFYPTDGMTLFQRDGDEYFRVMGGWDVTASPGVTAREGMDKLIPVTNWRGYCSQHNFAVGTTDGGENAVGGYLFEKMHGASKKGVNDQGDSQVDNSLLYGFKAYKGYFILGDYFIALGAGITNNRPEMEGTIRTTIDQTAWVGPVYIDGQKKESFKEEVKAIKINPKKTNWITQEGKFSYAVLPQYTKNLQVACETRPASWEKFNPSNAKLKGLPTELPTLRLWIDHGQQAVDDTYGYVVYAGQVQPASKLPFEVLRNDTLVQAIRSKDKKVVEAVFYSTSSRLEAKKLTLEVSSPCAVLLQKKKDGLTLSVTDATMNAKLKSITVTLNGKPIIISLPTGLHCGKPTTVVIKED